MQLPFVWPISETFQSSSLVMGVLLSHDNISEAYHNSFINLYCKKEQPLWDMDMKFWGASWEDFRQYGIFEMDLFHINHFDRNSLISFFQERIDQDNYILLHFIDEFYLSYSSSYQKSHFIHDAYIIGYKKGTLTILAYSNGKLQIMDVKSEAVAEAIFSCNAYEEEVYFCSLRVNHSVNVNLDYRRIRKNMLLYLGNVPDKIVLDIKENVNGSEINIIPYTPFCEDEYVYGNNIYDALIQGVAELTDDVNIDIRPFRLIWEHIKLLSERIVLIENAFCLNSESSDEFNKLAGIMNGTFMLAIKYNVTKDKNMKERIMNSLLNIKEKEKNHLMTFLKKWDIIN